MRFLLYLHILSFTIISTTSWDLSNTFNITIKVPRNISSNSTIPYKSIHVQNILPINSNRWNIVEIDPFIRIINDTIEQLTVHICQLGNNIDHEKFVWYDDKTYCNGAPSMLIYQWAPYSSLYSFRIADDLAFQLDKSKSIVLSVIYSEEQPSHQDRSKVILYISTLMPRFHVGTLLVGNEQNETRFSCRSPNYLRLLYAIKPLFARTNDAWWRIFVIRNRNFGRKMLQFVLDSSIFLSQNTTDIETAPADIFLLPGDYVVIECEQTHDSVCKFLIFYTYKNIQYTNLTDADNICQNNKYPKLFKLLPTKTIAKTSTIAPHVSSIDATTVLIIIAVLLFVIWLSIIIGCVIMRRIRGLVNFRTEPASPVSMKSKRFFGPKRPVNEQAYNRAAAEGDQIAQLDIEHMGLMS